MADTVVEISRAVVELSAHWRELTERSAANVFVDPAITHALQTNGFEGVLALTAWDRTDGNRLVGVWALGHKAVTPMGPTILTAPPHDYCLLSNPVIDEAYLDTVMPAFLDAIADDSSLPSVIRLRYLDGGSPSYTALTAALSARRARFIIVREDDRAFASPGAGVKQAGATRRKLRQNWNGLARVGSRSLVNDRDPAAVTAAFETFLTIESESWKAERDVAVMSEERNARLARAMVAALAAEGGASVALLLIDDRAIAALVLFYAGRVAFTWKTTFDRAYEKYSPGALLHDRITEELLGSGAIDAVDSCSHFGGFATRLWTGRRKTADLVIDLSPRKSPAFFAAQFRARGHVVAGHWRKRLKRMLPGRAIVPLAN